MSKVRGTVVMRFVYEDYGKNPEVSKRHAGIALGNAAHVINGQFSALRVLFGDPEFELSTPVDKPVEEGESDDG